LHDYVGGKLRSRVHINFGQADGGQQCEQKHPSLCGKV
jgi:hypothetical protein